MSDAKKFMRRQVAGYTHRGTKAINILMEQHPGFAAFSLYTKHVDDDRESNFPGSVEAEVWNNGKRIHYTKRFEDLDLHQQVGRIAHHLMHIALCHVQRARRLKSMLGSKFDTRLFILATDAIVNEALQNQPKLKAPEPTLSRLLQLYDGWCEKTQRPKRKHQPPMQWATEDAYWFLQRWLEDMKDDILEELQEILDGIDIDIDFDSFEALQGLSMSDAAKQDDDDMRQWANRFQRAQAGDRPGGIFRKISGDLPEVKTPWPKLLRTTSLRAISKQPSMDWARPNRRTVALMTTVMRGRPVPLEPTRAREKKAPKIAICVDTSGSITDEILDLFAAQMNSLQKSMRTQLRIIVCDAAVEEVVDVRPDTVHDVLKKVEFKGGGGTDFRPALEEAGKWQPDICVYLTDLMGSFPDKAPKFPVLWAVLPIPGMNLEQQAPFGQVIRLE